MKNFRRLVGVLLSLAGLGAAGGSWADDYSDGWGPEVGSMLPLLEAPDQTGRMRNLANLSGEHGLLLFLNRSADW